MFGRCSDLRVGLIGFVPIPFLLCMMAMIHPGLTSAPVDAVLFLV